ncbi:MAG TPA: PaaI family thioesterase [Acidimicrobiales bacterium]|nr:PaaI family thioesterase [Acidimicrobiales bacterium]
MRTEQWHEAMPLGKTLNMTLVSATADEVVVSMPWSETLTTTGGALHGGAVMALADGAGGTCAFMNLPAGAGTSTISSATQFLRGVRSGVVTAVSRPIHVGRTTIAVETELRDDEGRLVAKVNQTQAVLLPT